MNELSDRQKRLLQSIIQSFIETADPVGSISLLNKYEFNISSATIRNEMAELVFRGYLYKKHSSAGRIPTTKGWRFFVDGIEKNLNFIDTSIQLKVEDTLSQLKNHRRDLIRQSLNFLTLMAENATVAMVGNDLYYSGLSTLTEIPEFRETDSLQRILQILEDYYTLSKVFNEKNTSKEDVQILIGEEETKHKMFKNYTVLFSEIKFEDGERGFISVIGPNRMRYDKIIPALQYISKTVQHIVSTSN